MTTEHQNPQVAEAQKRCDIAGAVEETATRLCHMAAPGWGITAGLLFEPHWWAWIVGAAVYFAAYFVLKRPYDKMYDAAWDSYMRLTETGPYWKGFSVTEERAKKG